MAPAVGFESTADWLFARVIQTWSKEYTQIDTQKFGKDAKNVVEIILCWPLLPNSLRAAALAVVRSGKVNRELTT